MDNAYDTIRKAIEEVRSLKQATQSYAQSLGYLLEDNIRYISPTTAKKLKKALEKFDSRNYTWRD